eukprot:m.999897 g.999897  ORF g.999897 m.999897 type:complete len:84 (-) comp24027_c0_seq7:2755-3006(-)
MKTEWFDLCQMEQMLENHDDSIPHLRGADDVVISAYLTYKHVGMRTVPAPVPRVLEQSKINPLSANMDERYATRYISLSLHDG